VGEPARDLLPCGDPLGDHQSLLGDPQVLHHEVERGGDRADLVLRAHRDPVVEVAARGGERAGDQLVEIASGPARD